jgi:hypothetical protein
MKEDPVIPESSPPALDMRARITDVRVINGYTKIFIGRGGRSGARAGMKGYVVGIAAGRNASFVVGEQNAIFCAAFVDLTPDELAGCEVVLNPSASY